MAVTAQWKHQNSNTTSACFRHIEARRDIFYKACTFQLRMDQDGLEFFGKHLDYINVGVVSTIVKKERTMYNVVLITQNKLDIANFK